MMTPTLRVVSYLAFDIANWNQPWIPSLLSTLTHASRWFWWRGVQGKCFQLSWSNSLSDELKEETDTEVGSWRDEQASGLTATWHEVSTKPGKHLTKPLVRWSPFLDAEPQSDISTYEASFQKRRSWSDLEDRSTRQPCNCCARNKLGIILELKISP